MILKFKIISLLQKWKIMWSDQFNNFFSVEYCNCFVPTFYSYGQLTIYIYFQKIKNWNYKYFHNEFIYIFKNILGDIRQGGIIIVWLMLDFKRETIENYEIYAELFQVGLSQMQCMGPTESMHIQQLV